MDGIGPLYCETGTVLGVINEPVNTFTNIASFAAALVAIYILRKMNGHSWETWMLIALLVATGIGSTFWHATREPLVLTFDVLPGALFFILFLFLWVRELKNRFFGYGAVVGLLLVQWGGSVLPVISETLWGIRVHSIMVAFGLFLVFYTYRLRGRAVAFWALVAILLYAIAAFARTIDLFACTYIPFGTHFLWHISLASGACAGILLIAMLQKGKLKAAPTIR